MATPPIDPNILALLDPQNITPYGMSPQGLLSNTSHQNILDPSGNLITPSINSAVNSTVAQGVNLNQPVGLNGNTLGSTVGANVGANVGNTGGGKTGGFKMPSVGDIGEIMGSMTTKDAPLVESPQARASGYSQAAPSQANPYASAAANQGLLDMLRKAYSLGV